MVGLSVIIITKNEALNIRECLKSVQWADEIIVVDSGSMDTTVSICREFTPHVYTHDWPGFGMQKNRALHYATQEWVLSLDADERVTPELRSEIERTMHNGREEGYELPRLSSFCGRYMQHSGWYPDYVTRLFKREKGQFSNDLVHERVLINGSVGRLKQNILHESFRDLDQLLAKMNHYSSAGAAMMGKKGRDATLTQAILHGLWAFIRSYFLRAGFLDGREGFMLAVSTAEATYYRYVKRLLIQQRDSAYILDIVEPTLMSEAGHCLSFVNSLIAASDVNKPIRLWVSRQAAISINFGHVEMRRYFYRSLRRLQSYFLYKKLLKRKGRLFVSTAIRTDMLMLDWAAGGTIPPRKAYLYSHWFKPSTGKLLSLKKLAMKQPNLVILGPTSSVVNVFKEAGFSDTRVVPYPITPRKENTHNHHAPFRYLLYAGAARPDKGFKEIVDLVEYLHQQQSQIPVVIQTSAEYFDKYDAATLADIARLKSTPFAYLTLRSDVLSASEYEEIFSGAIAIQLYKSTDFTDRVSGVTLDAFSAGCPVITTADTWIARMVERFDAGLVVDNILPEVILSRVTAIISDYSRYAVNANNAGKILQLENNANNLYGVLTE